MYQYDQRPGTKFSESSNALLQEIINSENAVLVGRNNCGKSYILKTLAQQIGKNASYIGPARYQNFNLLGYYTPNRSKKDQKFNEFVNLWRNQSQNIDNSPLNLQQAIAELSDAQRDSLKEIIKLLLNTNLDILHTVQNNSMSQKYISCGGHNISYTSSGFRLITTLITCLLDDDYDTLLIDEPELGISPEAQGVVADFLFDREHRLRYFPHIKTLITATHSTVFLDRHNIRNNYCVQKNADEISIIKTETQMDFNNIHFFLLGNRFETLYLPSLIFLVEGKSDHKFLEKVLSAKYPQYQFSLVYANSDNRIKEILNTAKNLLTDINKSPYKDRIFIILDSVHTKGLKSTLVEMGIPEDNIVIWPKNGIEYYYPPAVLDSIYGADGEIQINGDSVSRNGIVYTKNELAEKVANKINPQTELHPDFKSLLITKIERKLGLTRE